MTGGEAGGEGCVTSSRQFAVLKDFVLILQMFLTNGSSPLQI